MPLRHLPPILGNLLKMQIPEDYSRLPGSDSLDKRPKNRIGR